MRNWNNIFIKLELLSDGVMEFGNSRIKTKILQMLLPTKVGIAMTKNELKKYEKNLWFEIFLKFQ